MGRRVYLPAGDRQKLQQDVLLAMRDARRKIGDKTLDQARQAILKAGARESASPAPASHSTGDEPVESTRTLTILRDYLVLMRGNKTICSEVSDMIAERFD